MKRVADIIIETLVKQGITDCFAVVGGGAMYLDNALYRNHDMHKYFCHHEQACAMAAEGYARYSGNIPLVCVTSGPGTTNTLTGVMGAWLDSIPMLIISGQMRYDTTVASTGLPLRFRGSQEFNIVDTVKTMTKASKMLLRPQEVKMEVLKAVDLAMSGRRGPVWLDIPLDIQMAEIADEDSLPYNKFNDEKLVGFSTGQADMILKKLGQAKRPLILAGNGIANSGNLTKFREFIRKINIPYVGSGIASDIGYREDPNYYGISGLAGSRSGNFVLQNADCILTLGTSLGYKTTGYNQKDFAKHAFIMMLDADPYEAKKPGLKIDEFIQSDLNCFFQVMETKLERLNITEEWRAYCDHIKSRFSPFEATRNLDMNERVCAYYFWQEFEKYEPDDSVVLLSNNTGITAKIQIGVQKEHQRCLVNNNCGSMGDDLPQAAGAAVASNGIVICATGDGSIMMNLQELQTIKHNNLPVKILLFSNDGYNAIRQTSKNYFHGECIGCSPETGISFPNWKYVADTFGYVYHVCHNNKEVDASLQWLFQTEGQAILVIEERLDEPVTPKVMSRVDENGKFISPALEDMYPFISKKEHDSLMIDDKYSEDGNV